MREFKKLKLNDSLPFTFPKIIKLLSFWNPHWGLLLSKITKDHSLARKINLVSIDVSFTLTLCSTLGIKDACIRNCRSKRSSNGVP